jgi:hypothetical protein
MQILGVTQNELHSVWSAAGNRRPTECLQNTGGAPIAALMCSVSSDINEGVEGKILDEKRACLSDIFLF